MLSNSNNKTRKESSLNAEASFQQKTVIYATEAQELLAKLACPAPEQGWRSDHLHVTHANVPAISWNTLLKCDEDAGLYPSNNVNKKEGAPEYQERLRSNLVYLNSLVSSLNTENTASFRCPISIICLQEVSTALRGGLTADQIEFEFQKINFTTKTTDQAESSFLMQSYFEGKTELLVIAYDPLKLKYVRSIDFTDSGSLNKDNLLEIHKFSEQIKDGRFQVAFFLHKEIMQEFAVVNVHQNWGLVNRPRDITSDMRDKPPEGSSDILHLLEYFKKINMPCIILGDFNTSTIPLPAESGEIIYGKNANLGPGRYDLDSCDHIIMNEKYCTEFLPALRKSKTIGFSEGFQSVLGARSASTTTTANNFTDDNRTLSILKGFKGANKPF